MPSAPEPLAGLWHAAGRAARDGSKRWVALWGCLALVPALVLGAWLWRGPLRGVAGMERPLAWVLEPLLAAWRGDRDLALLGYVALQGALALGVVAFFGSALGRLAALDLATGRRAPASVGWAFARRRWASAALTRLAFLLGFALPLAVLLLLALLGRVPGPAGSVLLALVALAAVPLVLLGVLALGTFLVGGSLAPPAVAAEASGALAAVDRASSYVRAGPLRVVGLRLLFAAGVLVGSGWRAAGTVLAGALGFLVLREGAGSPGLDRALAVLGSTGLPPDAGRLGVSAGDVVLAVVLAVAAAALALHWLADLAVRVACARTAVFLHLRAAVDGVRRDHLAPSAEARPHRDAAAAGFREVGRVP